MQLSSLLLGGKGEVMTSLFTVTFIVFFLLPAIVIYSLCPQRVKKYFLLAASIAFFWLISGTLVVHLLLTVLGVHYFGLWLESIKAQQAAAVAAADKAERKAVKRRFQQKSRRILALAAAIHIGVLLTVKYSAFFTCNINTLLAAVGAPIQLAIPKYLMPIGISFYTLQAVSYLFDVYRGVIKADGNLPRLALFMSFFPQIIEGPICRYSQTAEQLWSVKAITAENFSLGARRLIFGLMKKLVIADRLNPLIKAVFDNDGYRQFSGGVIAVAAVCYTLQLYMDFSGTMDAVVGIGRIFGIEMPENFERPFFSRSISEFWKRWHITLGAWFKDYIFYPVTMSKPMKSLTSHARKRLGNHFGPLVAGSIALFCVWICNGLWHGAAWSYIFFGMYHFVLILLGNLTSPASKWALSKLHIKPEGLPWRIVQMLRTSVLVVIGELFFRAPGLKTGLRIFRRMVTRPQLGEVDAELFKKLGVDISDLAIVAVCALIIFAVSLMRENGIKVNEAVSRRPRAVRWAVTIAMIMFIVIFGAYGKGYVPVDPMYANF